MGRVKLQIKRIENTTNRQVTFSKRRNGLIKKAYELSVLCDVDIALIMFSPSGRVSHFSGNNKSIEDILTRYINLPEPERGRLHNQEFLKRALGKLRGEANRTHQEASPTSSDSLLEEIQQDILRCKAQLEDMENRLRIYEGDPSEITTLCEAEYREQILEETLRRVHMSKQVLEGKYNSSGAPTAASTVPPNSADVRGIAPENPTNMLDWLPQRDPQVQIRNFLDSNGLLPLRGQQQHLVEVLPPPPTLFRGPNTDFDDHLNSRSGVVDESQLQRRRPEFGQVIDVNLSPSTELYPAAGNGNFPAAQSGARALLELYDLSQITPSTIFCRSNQRRR